MLSRGRIIRLFARPLPPSSPVSKLDRRHTGRLRKGDNLLTGGGGGGRMGEEPNHTTERKPGPLQIIQYFLEETSATISQERQQHYQYSMVL
jgi:hypothetical protein